MTPTTKLALIGAAHVEIAELQAAHMAKALDAVFHAMKPRDIYTCHDCGHTDRPRDGLEPGFEIVDGKSVDRMFPVCVRCESAEIYPVGEPL
jgi:hypothetical protein